MAFAFIGAGCFGNTKPVEGDWVLAFTLPKEWVMVAAYQEEINLDKEILRTDTEVYLQSTDQTIVLKDLDSNEDSDNKAIKVSVSQLDSRRVVPSEAEVLENGFSKLDPCAISEDCKVEGSPNMKYYLELDGKKYLFNVFISGGKTLEEAEKVIFSAKSTMIPAVDNGFVE